MATSAELFGGEDPSGSELTEFVQDKDKRANVHTVYCLRIKTFEGWQRPGAKQFLLRPDR
jgi:hypothetical protein